MDEFFRSSNGQRLLNDIHSIAQSLKVIAENIKDNKNKESEGIENESI